MSQPVMHCSPLWFWYNTIICLETSNTGNYLKLHRTNAQWKTVCNYHTGDFSTLYKGSNVSYQAKSYQSWVWNRLKPLLAQAGLLLLNDKLHTGSLGRYLKIGITTRSKATRQCQLWRVEHDYSCCLWSFREINHLKEQTNLLSPQAMSHFLFKTLFVLCPMKV